MRVTKCKFWRHRAILCSLLRFHLRPLLLCHWLLLDRLLLHGLTHQWLFHSVVGHHDLLTTWNDVPRLLNLLRLLLGHLLVYRLLWLLSIHNLLWLLSIHDLLLLGLSILHLHYSSFRHDRGLMRMIHSECELLCPRYSSLVAHSFTYDYGYAYSSENDT